MDLLRELMEMSGGPAKDFMTGPTVIDKYSPSTTTGDHVSEGVDNVVDLGPNYIPMKKPGKSKNAKLKSRQPTTDAAQNSLINDLWFMNNSDAN